MVPEKDDQKYGQQKHGEKKPGEKDEEEGSSYETGQHKDKPGQPGQSGGGPAGGTGLPTHGPTPGTPPKDPPGQPKGPGQTSADADEPTEGSPAGQKGSGGGQSTPPHQGGR